MGESSNPPLVFTHGPNEPIDFRPPEKLPLRFTHPPTERINLVFPEKPSLKFTHPPTEPIVIAPEQPDILPTVSLKIPVRQVLKRISQAITNVEFSGKVRPVTERIARETHGHVDSIRSDLERTTHQIKSRMLSTNIRTKLTEVARERAQKHQAKAEKQARLGQERKTLLKAALVTGGALLAGGLIPETRAIGKGAFESFWSSAMKGSLDVAPFLEQAEDVVMKDGVDYFRRYGTGIFRSAKDRNPEIFDPTRELPRYITCEVQQSDSLRYPNRPPENTSFYLKESQEASELMVDGIAELYLDGLITFPNDTVHEPLLLAEIQQQARAVAEAVKNALKESGKTDVPVATLNDQTQNNGALVTNGLAMQEMIAFAKKQGTLTQTGARLHNPLNKEDNAGLPEPQTAAISRQQAYIIELAYRNLDFLGSPHLTIEDVSKIRKFERSDEGKNFLQNVFLSRICPGLDRIEKKPNGQLFTRSSMQTSLIALHLQQRFNLHNLDSITPQQVDAVAEKLQASGSRFNAFNIPGSVFGLGAGVIIPRRLSHPHTQPSRTSEPRTMQQEISSIRTKISRRKFLFGAGVTAATAAIAYEAKANPKPVIADALFDGDTWERFLKKAPLLTRKDITVDIAGSTTFYYNDGRTLIDGAHEQSKEGSFRESVSADEIPDFLKMAIVQVEDQRMYEHDGVDPFGITRAIKAKLQGDSEGASTIAMQVVRNVFGNISFDSRNWDNKKLEVVGALFLFQHEKEKAILAAKGKGISLTEEQARKAAHDKILTDYLNIAPFRGNIYGVKKAAETFFGVSDPKELTEFQQLFLVGLPKSPVGYNPFEIKQGQNGRYLDNNRIELYKNHPAIKRMTTVLWMLENNPKSPVSPEHIAILKQQLQDGIIVTIPPQEDISPAFAYTQRLYDQIPAEQLSVESQVVTTIDPRLDRKVREIGNWATKTLGDELGTNRFDIVVRDMEGRVLAVYGDPAQSHMIGSVAKAFTVSAAMEAGLRPDDTVNDQPLVITDSEGNATYTSHNIDRLVHETNGQVTLNEAFERSYNNPFLHLIEEMGITRFTEMMQRLGGIDNYRMLDLNGLGPTATLGTNPITNALRISTAFTTLVSGIFHGSSGIQSISNPTLGPLYKRKPNPGEQVLDPEVAGHFIRMLSNPDFKLSGFEDNHYIVKTGTSTNESEDKEEGAFNGWTAGYAFVDKTHHYQITCVGYRDDGGALSPLAGGENTAGEVYKKIADFLFEEYQP